ncbi:MAG: hypothetical protein SFX73_32040 [Kofleriaceae bacterium]|nr:hypothetical protein [Kofleriaceae bacterium]
MRCVFLGSSAFLGRIEGETRCAFWAEEPSTHGFDATKLISLDLAMTPNAALEGRISWDAVQVDDCHVAIGGNLGGSTLGPRWPELHLYGAVYLEEQFRAKLPEAVRPSCPPSGIGGHAYEHTSVLYWPHIDDPRAGKRYAGHHAEIIDERGTVVRVRVYPPGTSDAPHAQPQTMWLDLAAPDQCDVGPRSLTQIAPADGPKTGALFLFTGALDA